MSSYLEFDLFAIPDPEPALHRLEGESRRGLLAIYQATAAEKEPMRDYLVTILEAAGYKPALNTAALLRLDAEEDLDLAAICRRGGFRAVLLFGLEPRRLGVHLRLPAYTAVKVNELTLLWSDSLQDIQAERQAGGREKAGALWQALKQYFHE